MKWPALLGVLTTTVLLGAGIGESSPALTCAKGSTPATIAGKRTCLKVGQKCAKALERQYRRYKFHCQNGRLVRQRPPVPLTPVTIALKEVDGSGVTGTATFTPAGGQTRVVLKIDNPPPGALPAHIHFDTCANTSDIRFSLTTIVDGMSETAVSGSIAYLRRGHGRFSVNVHRAEPDLPIIACGDVPPG